MTQTTPIQRRKRRAEPGAAATEMAAMAETFHGAGNCDALRDLSFDLVQKISLAEAKFEKLSELQEALKEKCEKVTSPAHFQAIITAVSNNGQLLVEVAVHGSGKTRVAVHPDIEFDRLRVGASGWITSERNCLISVSEDCGPWKDVAQFENYLDSESEHDRPKLLLKERDSHVVVDAADELENVQLRKGDLVGYDRDVGLAYQRVESPDKNYLFDENVPGNFDELVGLEKPIARIQNLIDFRFLHPEIAARYELPDRCGIIVYGSPGNGKTHLARCVANYVKQLFPGQTCRFMHVAGSADYSMWFGESERQIIERFNAARDAAQTGPVVMFFDEIDAIGRSRGSDHGSGAHDRVLNTMLSQLDGVLQNSNIIVMAATNRVDILDPGLTRPGRFDYKIELPKPNRRTTLAILRRFLGNGKPLARSYDDLDELVSPLASRLFAPNGQYAEVAKVKLSDGRRLAVPGRELVSGAMLKNVVNVASRQAALRETQTGERGIREDDLLSALDDEIYAVVSLLAPANVQSYVDSISRDAHPIDIEVTQHAAASSNFLRQEV